MKEITLGGYSFYLPKLWFKQILRGNLCEAQYILEKDDFFSIITFTGKRLLSGYGKARIQKYEYGLDCRLNDLASKYGIGSIIPLDTFECGSVVVDIGANIGEFTIYALSKGAMVLSVEPDPVSSMLIKKNIRPFKNRCKLIASIIGNHSGPSEWYSAADTADSSILEPDKFQHKCILDSITLDELFVSNSLDNVSLLKCDAEGAEPEVFSTAELALSKTRVVTVNCGPERFGECTTDQVIQILQRNNFECQIVDGYLPKTIVIGKNRSLSANLLP